MHGDATLYMGHIVFTADDEHKQIVSEVKSENDVESQSEAVRECIGRYVDLHQEVDELKPEPKRVENKTNLSRTTRRKHTAGRVCSTRKIS
jgi:hypothetical protein